MKINRDDLARFFDRKGFYIVLFLCIVVVAVTAVYVTNNNLKKMAELGTSQEKLSTTSNSSSPKNLITEYPTTTTNNNNSSTAKEESKTKVENIKATNVASSNKADVSKTDTTKTQQNSVLNTMSNNVAASTMVKNESDATLSLIKPVNGDVVMEFAVTKLTYSKTLDEWTTHKGVDLKANVGTDVVAAMSGVVTKIYNDSRLGNTVEIKNGSYITRYSNLDDNINVKVGQSVEKGSVIGKIGNSAKFEIAEESHIHFELLKDGTYIDPMQYFK